MKFKKNQKLLHHSYQSLGASVSYINKYELFKLNKSVTRRYRISMELVPMKKEI